MQVASWVEKLDDKFGHLAIPNLTRYLVGLHLATYVLNALNPGFADALLLDGRAVKYGEVWRPITFMFVPELDRGPLLVLIYLWFTWVVGDALEHEWGPGKLNIYFLTGMIALTVASLFFVIGPVPSDLLMASLILPFGVLFPLVEFLIFFILPVQVRYLAMFYGGFMALAFLLGFLDRAVVLASLVPFIFFFGPTYLADLKLQREVKERRRRFQEK